MARTYFTRKGKDKPADLITVRLDQRTVITLRNEKALAFWRTRYPNLTIITKPE
jgi:hypothetical protein